MTRIRATDDQILQWVEQVDGALNELLTELADERARSREMFRRSETAENALYDAQRGWRERMSDWWLERRGGGAI